MLEKYKVNVACSVCEAWHKPTKYDFAAVIERCGKWTCKPCATSARNMQNARPVGDVRMHKQSGYIDEKTTEGWRRQHIVVFEKHVGRKLRNNEVVHHINEIKTDNRIENLALMNIGEHTILHHTGRTCSAETKEKIRGSNKKAHGWTLTPEVARNIRADKASIGLSAKALSIKYSISITAAQRAIRKETWNQYVIS